MLLKLLILFISLFFFSIQSLLAQTSAEMQQARLENIRLEMRKVKQELEAVKKKESSELYVLKNLELEIDLTQSMVQNLQKERRKRSTEISRIEKSLEVSKEELARLKDRMGKRLAHIYKYGRVKDIELLITARSLNDGLLWLEYQKRLSENDYRNYLKIKEKQNQISHNRDLLGIELEQKKKLLANKISEEKKLSQNKKKRQSVLSSIRKDTELLRAQLADKEKAAGEIEGMIARLETHVPARPVPRPDVLFAQLKGQILWPVAGKVVCKFGKYKHPQLQTITENIGIEISAPLTAPVQVVASGSVIAITWQRGFGNIIIVSHFGGYNTVYTHLDDIYVDPGDEVDAGRIIGTVGESGAITEPVLGFQIWKGTEKLNPELWLAKSTGSITTTWHSKK